MTLSETFIIALLGLIAVFAVLVLYAISLVTKLLKISRSTEAGASIEEKVVQSHNNTSSQTPVQSFNDSDDEEDRLVVALAASVMASNDKPDSYFHITKITRIK
jgi:Na+-transporting methylmalonyl-CoA/oxaloacetate decarboxylase gamma subunit